MITAKQLLESGLWERVPGNNVFVTRYRYLPTGALYVIDSARRLHEQLNVKGFNDN